MKYLIFFFVYALQMGCFAPSTPLMPPPKDTAYTAGAQAVEEAKTVVDALHDRYINGEPLTSGFVERECLWSQRLAQAQVRIATTPAERRAAIAGHVNRMYRMHTVFTSRVSADHDERSPLWITNTEVEFFFEDAWAWLASDAAQSDTPTTAPAEDESSRAAEDAKTVVDAWHDRHENGEPQTIEFIERECFWSRRLAEAEVRIATTPAARRAAIAHHLERMSKMQDEFSNPNILDRPRGGPFLILSMEVDFFCDDARAWLAADAVQHRSPATAPADDPGIRAVNDGKKVVDALDDQRGNGEPLTSQFIDREYVWSRRLAESELRIGHTAVERHAAIARHADRMAALQGRISRILVETENMHEALMVLHAEAGFYRDDAKAWLGAYEKDKAAR